MGTGAIINHGSGADFDGSAGLCYRFCIGRGNPAMHDPSPIITSKPAWVAIVDAALVGQQDFEAHVQANHPALWVWLGAKSAQSRILIREATAALRGL